MKSARNLMAAAFLLAGLASSQAGFRSYIQTLPGKHVPTPTGDSVVNSVVPENSGAYMVVWDQTGSGNALLEHRDVNNNVGWQMAFTNSPNEGTRLVLAGDGKVLWATAVRWALLEQETGTLLRSGTWAYPNLDSRKVIVRGDVFYIQQGTQLTGYNTAMDCTGTLTSDLEEGRWDVVEGTWLIDRMASTNHCLRIATLTDGLQAVNVREIALLSDRDGGYTTHLPLSANASTLVVASTMEWTPATSVFYTMTTRDGEVLWQNRVDGSEHITGCAVLTNGWLLSGIDFKASTDNQYLRVVDFCGWLQPRQYYDPSQAWEYTTLNTTPPRLLRALEGNALQIYDLAPQNWTPWWFDFMNYWDDFWIGPPFEPQNNPSFWRTPTSPPR